MQFMPATWAAYGLGGDISDPRDAILGAANYLHANGAPGDETRALFRYNPSSDYVRAVSRYARRIRADWRRLLRLLRVGDPLPREAHQAVTELPRHEHRPLLDRPHPESYTAPARGCSSVG